MRDVHPPSSSGQLEQTDDTVRSSVPAHPADATLRRRSRTVATAVAAALAISLLVPLASPATAQTIESKRAEAAQIAAELQELEFRLSELNEDFNQATVRLEELDHEIADGEARVAVAEGDLAEAQLALRDIAVTAYMSGGAADELETLLATEQDQFPARRTYAEATSGSRRSVMEQIEASRQRADAEIAQLEASRAEADEAAERIDASRQEANRAANRQQELQDRVQGELAQLVREEEERQAREAQRRAEEAARQAAAEQERRAAQERAATPTTEAQRNGSTSTSASGSTNGSAPAADTSTSSAAPSTTEGAPSVIAAAPPTPAPAPAPAPSPSGGASAAIAAAQSQLGVRYTWGGSSPATGFDCSGLTSWAWAQAGRSIPRTAESQQAGLRSIAISELQPGDLVFYGRTHTHHVALYVGGGSIIHAPNRNSVVRYDSLNYWPGAMRGAARV
ncbi:MAG: C40 family peptidase [Acidimicrobiia bacterium]|nr:C40 family peptidase [Acidimicrobiia bacterium]